ncbi:unnamed protein product, partial [Heterosigma akashiwo]
MNSCMMKLIHLGIAGFSILRSVGAFRQISGGPICEIVHRHQKSCYTAHFPSTSGHCNGVAFPLKIGDKFTGPLAARKVELMSSEKDPANPKTAAATDGLSGLTVVALKQALRDRGLRVSGNKGELVQ